MFPAKGKGTQQCSCQMPFAVYIFLFLPLPFGGRSSTRAAVFKHYFEHIHWHQCKIPIHQIPFNLHISSTANTTLWFWCVNPEFILVPPNHMKCERKNMMKPNRFDHKNLSKPVNSQEFQLHHLVIGFHVCIFI